MRSQLGDGPDDKFEFKSPVFPTPDTVATRFFCGETRLVDATLQVYHNGVLVVPTATPDWERGTFDYAPSGAGPSGEVEVSFYYQWFTDEELVEFLTEAANLLGFETMAAITPVSVRSVVVAFACYSAYMRKAAQFAETVEATAAGYSFNRGRASPNWKELARAALDAAKEKLKIVVDNQLGTKAPALAWVAFKLAGYTPP